MDLVKRIAVTASTMFFVLAQIFSLYVIFTGQREKLSLIREKEQQIFAGSTARVVVQWEEMIEEMTAPGSMAMEQAAVYCFRSYMPEHSALYRGQRELFHRSAYDFMTADLQLANGEVQSRAETVDGTRLLVFYQCYVPKGAQQKTQEDAYFFFYTVDVSELYRSGLRWIFWELLLSLLISAGMAVLLVVLIQKITKPLQDLNETQRQLIGSMSHELKTPLTAIKGYSETLLRVQLSAERREKALDYIYRESGRLSRLSEKMMELTKLYEPECKIEFRTVSLEELFDMVEESVALRLKEAQMTLVREGSWKGESRRMDADLMASFLLNLVNNSITASAPGSCIYLGADPHALWVRDEGKGIAAAELGKVRRAFYRVDPSRSRKSGNMGIGLALCDQIANVHGRRMEIFSEPGVGTQVRFTESLPGKEDLVKKFWYHRENQSSQEKGGSP